jgi:hypothetical protein
MLGLAPLAWLGGRGAGRWLERFGAAAAVLAVDTSEVLRRVARRDGRAHLAALALIVVAGAGIRLWLLHGAMGYDESYTFLNYARYPLVLGLTRYDAPNNHLFHTFLVHLA